MGFVVPVHPDWKTEASILTSFQPMWDHDHFVDRFVAYITGQTVDGRRYCRAVEVTGSAIESGSAGKRLEHVRAIVTRDGPSLCTAITEGGPLPREKDQPSI
jgi:hypothetical protein